MATAFIKKHEIMLHSLKQGQVNSRKELVKRLNRGDATITRWLNKYREGGLGRVFAPADTLEGCGYTSQVRLRGLRKNKVWLPAEAGFVRATPQASSLRAFRV
jgi:transposase-like protein